MVKTDSEDLYCVDLATRSQRPRKRIDSESIVDLTSIEDDIEIVIPKGKKTLRQS